MRDFVSVPAHANMVNVMQLGPGLAGNAADFIFQAVIHIPVKVRCKVGEIVTGRHLPFNAKLNEYIYHFVCGGHGAIGKGKPTSSASGENVKLEKLFQKLRLMSGMQRYVPEHGVDIFALLGRKLPAILQDDRTAFHLMAEKVIAIGEGHLDIEVLPIKMDRQAIQYQVSHGKGVSSGTGT